MSYMPKKIEGASVDELVLKGVKHIINNGERISSRAEGLFRITELYMFCPIP